jgi:hypothetical protein
MRRVLAGVVTGLAFSIGAVGCVEMAEPEGLDEIEQGDQAAAAPRASTMKLYMELDGVGGKPVSAVSGGVPVGNVASARVSGGVVNKSISSATQTDLSFSRTGKTSLQDTANALNEIVSGRATPHAVRLLECDMNFECPRSRTYHDAIATELKLPSFDSAAKDTAQFATKVGGGEVRFSGNAGRINVRATREVVLGRANFRLETSSPDLPAGNVTKVELPTVTRPLVPTNTGVDRIGDLLPGELTISNMKVTVTGNDIDKWVEWYFAMVVERPRPSDELEQNFIFHGLNPALDGELFTVEMQDVGVLRYEETPASDSAVRSATFELYVDNVRMRVVN